MYLKNIFCVLASKCQKDEKMKMKPKNYIYNTICILNVGMFSEL